MKFFPLVKFLLFSFLEFLPLVGFLWFSFMEFEYHLIVNFLLVFLQSDSFKNQEIDLWLNKATEWSVQSTELQIRRALSMRLKNNNEKIYNFSEILFWYFLIVLLFLLLFYQDILLIFNE